ncbi:biopolymer transporter ExbD [Pseudogemmatithrix spongiicola]|uniref:Biopolymer transporter ExbD n=1 Tax=Pseudogemmatithrix spongiicola TaxID=3062599 RepID=A0AA49Q562_9BACT|nr:biopolymer transporter ExbD [Gemmatimonadaceae bacterium 'strain 138']WKW15489.1 biopolymer transporter ExbD [Gemmatimonadaceae bacterium 'strain 318']
MSVSTGGGVKAEPNVVPMIDVMLVLLIIFMVVTPAIAAGFTAEPPSGINLKSHPEADEDQVLGIDKFGNYFLNKQQIPNPELGQRLQAIYSVRTIDQILYVKADKNLEYGRILEAMDIAAKNGVRMVGAITDQVPGTVSTVEGDEAKNP